MKYNTNVTSQRRKQRLQRYNAELHERQHLMGCRLSKELREKYHVKAVPVCKGDQVKVMVGTKANKQVTGEVKKVDLANYKIEIEGLELNKRKTEAKTPFLIPACNCMITELKESENRLKAINRRAAANKQ